MAKGLLQAAELIQTGADSSAGRDRRRSTGTASSWRAQRTARRADTGENEPLGGKHQRRKMRTAGAIQQAAERRLPSSRRTNELRSLVLTINTSLIDQRSMVISHSGWKSSSQAKRKAPVWWRISSGGLLIDGLAPWHWDGNMVMACDANMDKNRRTTTNNERTGEHADNEHHQINDNVNDNNNNN